MPSMRLSPEDEARLLATPGVIVGPSVRLPADPPAAADLEPKKAKPKRGPKSAPAPMAISFPRTCLVVPAWHAALVNKLYDGHWAERKRLKDLDRELVGLAAKQQTPPRATGKRRVDLLMVMQPGQRKGDPDAYFKSTNDALVAAGLLVNDSSTWVKLGDVWFARDSEWWGTFIFLTEI